MANKFLNTLQAMGLYKAVPSGQALAGFDGIPPEMVQAARSQALTGVGGQLLAAGFARDPNARALALSNISDAGDMSRPLYNMAQAKLMATPRPKDVRSDIQQVGDRLKLIDLNTGDVIRDLGPAPVKQGGAGEDGEGYYGNVVWGQDPNNPNGPPVPYLIGKQGSVKQANIPGAIPPDQMAGNKAYNQTVAKNAPAIPAAVKQLEDGVKYITDLLNDPGLSTATGELQGNLPDIAYGVGSMLPGSWGQANTDALDARKRIEQVQGQAFLSAYETLKGTGQITEVEGAKAEAAKARLKTAVSDQDYVDALTDFRNALVELIPIVRAKGGQYVDGGGTTPPPAAGGAPRVRKFNAQTGKLE